MKKIITLITIMTMMIMAMFAFSACGNKEDATTEEVSNNAQTEEVAEEASPVEEDNNPLADTVWEMKTEDDMVLSSVKFNKDGTVEYTRDTNFDWAITHGTYEVEGSNIKVTFDDEEYYNKVKDANGLDDELLNTWKERDNTAIWSFDENTLTIKFKGMDGKNPKTGLDLFLEGEAVYSKK